MSFEAIFSPKSYKQLKSFDEKLKERIKRAINQILNDPWHKGTIKLAGYENIRRKRVGNYRVLYTIDKKNKEVLIIKVERRSETTYK